MDNRPSATPIYKKGKQINLPMIFGIILITLISYLAIFGPNLAPRDPMEQNNIIRIEGEWYIPPIPFLTPTFPLGSDSYGRDLLSRLLYGIKPTLQMVLVVASFRLVLGTVVGLIAGWSERFFGRLFDILISAALAVPVLIVALGGIAAIGVEYGLMAFIIGLSITGWVETARIIREQTETIRSQQYIEAAQAMGASSFTIIRKHILRQISSIIWILFAFEISGTLMLTAALGFLGYYIGGDVWVQLTDRVAQAISGTPELGQMLATSRSNITQPWGLLAVGSVIFFTVLGFNLFGEGLRLQRADGAGRRSAISKISAAIYMFIDQNFLWPVGNLVRSPAFKNSLNVLSAIIIIAGMAWLATESRPRQPAISPLFDQESPQWGSIGHDSFATRWSPGGGPESPAVVWIFEDTKGFTGGPAVSTKGALFITSLFSKLYALSPEGDVLWETSLPAEPVGTPAIGSHETLYIPETGGGLMAYSFQGEFLWHFHPEVKRRASSSAVVGSDGTIYYTIGGGIQAVTSSGKSLWVRSVVSNLYSSKTPHLNPEGTMLFLGEAVVDPKDGVLITDEVLTDVDQFVIGADGNLYLRLDHQLSQWSEEHPDDKEGIKVTWLDAPKYTLAPPQDAGVTPDHIYWLFYHGFAPSWGLGIDNRIVWLDEDSKELGNINYPTRNSRVIGVDHHGIVYVCGNRDQGYGAAECQAFDRKKDEPLWAYRLDKGHQVNGGAVTPGRLYISTEEGYLFALGTAEDRGPLGIAVQIEPLGGLAAPTDEETITSSRIGSIDFGLVTLFEDETGFVSTPLVGTDGTIYITSMGKQLYALKPNGEIIWQEELENQPVGNLVFNDEGQILVVQKEASLSVFGLDGEFAWKYEPEVDYLVGVSGGVLDPEGNIYYSISQGTTGMIEALSPSGEPLWRAILSTGKYHKPISIHPSGEFLFIANEIFNTRDGMKLEFELPFKVDDFFVGEDGETYLLTEGTVANVIVTPSGVIFSEERVIAGNHLPINVGVTDDKVVWLQYGNGAKWFTVDGDAIGSIYVNQFIPHFIDIEDDNTIYACGRTKHDTRIPSKLYCAALSPDSEDPLWVVIGNEEMDADEFNLVGGTVVPGRIYISTHKGRLYAIGSGESRTAQSDTITASDEFIFGSQNTGPETGDYITLLQDETGFSGMFTVSNEGLMYVSSENKILYAINLATNTYKTFTLPERAEGSPVLSEDGFIYILSRTGGLTKLTQKGEIIWHFQSPGGNLTFNTPSLGPDGTIYYVVQHGSTGFMQAVSPDGKALWATQLDTGKYFVAPQVTPDGLYIFIQNDIVSIEKGELLDIEIDENIRQFIVGDDNKTYYISAQSIVQVQVTPTGLIPLEKAAFAEADSNLINFGIGDAGTTEQGYIWIAGWPGLSLYEPDGNAVGVLRAARLFTIDSEGTIYFLSSSGGRDGSLVIAVANLNTLETSWEESIEVDLGHYWITDTRGILINGKLYIFFPGGSIVVVGDGNLEPATPE